MPTFSDISSMSKYIKNAIKEINEDKVSKEAKKDYEKAIDDTVYKVATTWQTGSFLNSVNTNSKSTKNSSSVKIFTDERLMTNSYPSLAEGYPQDNRSSISWWIDQGHGGIFNVPGRGYFKLFMTEYFTQSKLKGIMVKELGKLGIQAR